MELPKGFEWCRKGKYNVQIELACYSLAENPILLEGFEEKKFKVDGVETNYAVKSGFNVLEQNSWTTSPDRPFVITGTVGERWPVKVSNLSAYDIEINVIGIEPITVSTKDPSAQEFMVAVNIPESMSINVIPSWAFSNDGKIDETQIMVANSQDSLVLHNGGDYLVAKHIPGKPEYFQLPDAERNTKEAAKLYSPRIINGSVMQTTYDHALTQDEIAEKYRHSEMSKIKI